jgi:hypothetical protein
MLSENSTKVLKIPYRSRKITRGDTRIFVTKREQTGNGGICCLLIPDSDIAESLKNENQIVQFLQFSVGCLPFSSCGVDFVRVVGDESGNI